MALFRKRQKSDLPQSTAEQILHDVFDLCDVRHNTVPLEALTSYSNYRKERYTLQRTAILVMLLVFLLVPLLFLSARVVVSLINENNENSNPTYSVLVNTAIPVRQVEASLDDRTISVFEVASNEYLVQPDANGTMHIEVELFNHQKTSLDVTVESVDNTPPRLVSTEFAKDELYLYLSDADSNIDYTAIQVMDEENHQLNYTWNPDASCLTVQYPQGVLRVNVPDTRGNVLRLRLVTE